MTASARVQTPDGWRADVADVDLPELRDEMEELLAKLTGLVVTPRLDGKPCFTRSGEYSAWGAILPSDPRYLSKRRSEPV